MLSTLSILLASLTLTNAHYDLKWPTARSSSESDAIKFPCGGANSPSSERTEWPIKGGPVQLDMEHTQTNIEVLLAIGEDPGDNFNIVLRPTHAQEGLGEYCIGGLSVPEGINVTEGTKATIQIVSNGDPSGGLYQCADIIFTEQELSQDEYTDHCKNHTGVKVTSENIKGNPNETTTDGGDEPSHTHSETGTTATSTPKAGLGAHQTAATWAFGVIGLVGVALL